ncbi:leader peptidase (prepilin peptidase) / N-methyltransferase [Georgenia satyanarayanai]|uniref:Leader peptidase (Prepilin peptidase) / N-methyltransferase n=1 Tax=Georgenia satyanarayanai TaxID=860221 RepID=A0A2Y8ZX74_9MICO|nr:leader peptidase (prepilin peptidase)/N-methyltransferase [Georgenia satyanarayanai]SSA36921.1 leader peptidase (prepilin peptidase) / N-methyltransferase [Georgenia satyanarayanai]
MLAGACAVAVALTLLVHGWRADLPAALLLAVAGVLLATEDLASHRLPNAVLAPTAVALALLLVVASLATGEWDALLRAVLAAVASGVGYLLLALLRPAGLGMGDVKLGALLGAWLGWLGWGAAVLGVLAGFVLGGVAGLVLLLAGRATRTTAIAFGPWMLLGAAVAGGVTVRLGPVLGM